MMVLRSKIALSFLFISSVLAGLAEAQDVRLTLPDTSDAPLRLMLDQGHDGQDPAAMLQVFVGPADACCDGKSPIAGRYGGEGAAITFAPAFDFVVGQVYTVRTVVHGAVHLSAMVIDPDVAPVAPDVIAVFPSGPVIPENTLRFYVHFSTPMSPHLSTQFIHLMDANGVADRAAFMTFKQELWNEDRTRLTLLMDPGRIKRGVAQNLTLGPALEAGGQYSLRIDGGWPNARGDQRAAAFVQTFTVSGGLRAIPDVALWDVQAPRAATQDPMVVEFDRAFDAALVQDAITIVDETGRIVQGVVTISDHQRRWQFDPQSEWTGGGVRLVVDARLEDVAGNNFRELLDHSVQTPVRDIDQVVLDVVFSAAP